MISPVWRIKGLDPHCDTPVEILHVVLLGFVKYFWKDVIQNQLKNKKAKKDILAARLSSLDVSGLGLSRLAGHTLVQYAGSLVGRDFRAIAQVAPFVLHLVSPECYNTWVSLSKPVPLVWQPEIEDIDAHVKLLEREIETFLLTTAKWTHRWFNKPKFHILVHLPEHIRCFGPAILFATEGFESFNAIIRAKSIHSNRQAPSRDIARAFAQGNRIRHLVSGGWFQRSRTTPVDTDLAKREFSFDRQQWVTAGHEPRDMVGTETTVSSYLGLNSKLSVYNAKCHFAKKGPCKFSDLITASRLPSVHPKNDSQLFKTCTHFDLKNGDHCEIGSCVVVDALNSVRSLAVVEEIIAAQDAMSHMPPRHVLVRLASAERVAEPYGMPYMDLQAEWQLLKASSILCTVNTQHPCAQANCKPSGQVSVYEEREKTHRTKAVIEHRNHPDERVVNTAQMRDAMHLQRFRIPSQPLPVDSTLRSSAEATIAAKKALRKAASTSNVASAPTVTSRPTNYRLAALRNSEVI
ncbi:hypothetical protein CC1G_11482 [Coprinopsis cinerea okayama7|uniref:Uncharacterized protein n=1 Tax=Coprinopsis cinerea (strain Okayama-7 / 130 / ATCC MYA-4618 / FGSC 9003) TaxID=240176 RepID=A8NMR0_COPC7|nr:hypothetical protein CC1G_11482 [Coprinopsis cinerea okayama7\|eukprot:XP_001834968.2 hypothetical protein CC1G_11482 [Coprinopsis cinerea okayama7\